MFINLNKTVLCSSPCIILKAPAPSGFDVDAIPMDRPYTHEYDDILTSEIEFAKLHEYRNKFRLNKFIGGRIALRFVKFKKIFTTLSTIYCTNILKLICFVIRRAMKEANIHIGIHDPILKNEYNAPILSNFLCGSITHKDDIVAAVAKPDPLGKIGVDLVIYYISIHI